MLCLEPVVPEQGLRRKFGLGSASFRAVNRRGLDQKSFSARFAPQGGYARWREGALTLRGHLWRQPPAPRSPSGFIYIAWQVAPLLPQLREVAPWRRGSSMAYPP